MREAPLNKEARMHRLMNQRRIAYALIERSRTLLQPGTPFTRELHELFRSQGKFGSKDRRLYRELIYTFLRYLPWLEPIYKDQKEFMNKLICLAVPTAEIESLYPTLPDKRPPEFPENKRHHVLGREDHEILELLPNWFPNHVDRKVSVPSLLTLVSRPPLWLRIQKDPTEAVLQELKEAASPEQAAQIAKHPSIPDCIHAPANFAVSELPCYLDGRIEIQDISSQILLQLLAAPPSGVWLDACAGAGGKALQLAKALKPYGKVHAFEPRVSALRELKARAERSGLRNIELLHHRPTSGSYDGVLVDAPCSGTGTWRRHPYLMRQVRESDIFKHAKTQLDILQGYAPLVKPGGVLAYSTCSLSVHENQEVAKKFLNARPEFRHEKLATRFGFEDFADGITIHPEDHNGDGLYIATFRRSQS